MNAKFSNRFRAYLIDVVLLFLLLSFISPLLPKSGEEKKLVKEMEEVFQEYMDNEKKDKKEIEEASEKLANLGYKISKATYMNQIFSICVYLGYFVVMPIFTKGQTLGKKIMKIRIVDMDGNEVSGNKLLIRGLILYGIAVNTINLVLLLVLNKSMYMNISGLISTGFNIVLLVSFIMIIASKDKRGLHDLASGTKVISTVEESGE